jgi:cytochrome P450 monooxygenase
VPGQDLGAWQRQYSRYLLAGLPSGGRLFMRPIHWLATRARDWLDTRLGAMVDELRATGRTDTLAGAIANTRDEAGRFLDRKLVVANLRLLVFAGHETTASAIAWSVLHFADSPEIQRRALDESSTTDDIVAQSTAERMTWAEAQFREALRMYPSVHSVIRRATRPLDLDVGTIPGGTLMAVPLVHLLRDEKRFPEADRFDPTRWRERPKPGTLETAMFGNGSHFCLGYHIAIAEGTIFNLHLARALQRRGMRARAEHAGPVPRPVYLPLTHPPRSLAVRFER